MGKKPDENSPGRRKIFQICRNRQSLWACTLLASLSVVWLLALPIAAKAQTATPASAGDSSAPNTSVQGIPLDNGQSGEKAHRKTKYEITVTGEDWQATSISLFADDQVDFHADGQMTLSDGHVSKPDGVARGWKDLLRLYPLGSANSGALIGRIGSGDAALPFLIGNSRELTVPSSGQLYLRANVSPDLTADGSYKVKIQLHSAKPETSETAETPQAFAAGLSPALFAAIPRRVSDQLGNLGDMVNFALIGTEVQVKTDLAKAGWFPTDANSTDALFHGLLETLSHQTYTAVPMSTLYLFGRPQDMAYARAHTIAVAATRNHMRLWKTTETVDGLPLWVGSATHDNGFETDQRNGNVTHHIDPDIDQERDFILDSLKDAGAAKAAAYVLPANPVSEARTATGGSFNSDGKILVVLLQ